MIQEFFKTITSMPGPRFLVFYGIYFLVLLVLEWIALRWLDPSRNLEPFEVPEEEPDPYEIAALRGGPNELVRLYLFELFSNGLLELTKGWFGKVNKRSKIIRSKKPRGEVPELSAEGKTFLGWFETEREAKSVFTDSPLKSLADQKTKDLEDGFRDEKLIRSDWERRLDRMVRGVTIFLFVGLGMIKLLSALGAGRANVAFLFVGGWLGVLIFVAICSFGRLSWRGRRYVRDLQEKFQPDKKRLRAEISAGKNYSELVGVMGIMGIPILSGTDFAFFSKKFDPAQAVGGGCGGGCGGFGCFGGWSGCGGCGLG